MSITTASPAFAIIKPQTSGAALIDGRACAGELLHTIALFSAELKLTAGIQPGLAVVIVGEDAASQVYVKAKGKAADGCGFHSVQHSLPAATSEAVLLELVARLNADPDIHGILVQLPLPVHIGSARVLEAIRPDKDVDGFHPVNAGLLATGEAARALVPCTPAGVMVLAQRACQTLGLTLAGQNAVVIGRSNIVGKPMAQLLLQADATVTIAHSRSVDLPGIVRRADIVVAAVGRPDMVRGDWLKPGCLVFDVGINRVAVVGGVMDASGRPRTRLTGDVAFEEARLIARAITPVPGGAGPMTIAMLMANTCTAAARSAGKPLPVLW